MWWKTMNERHLKIQFVSDDLVQQIIDGEKTASVVEIDEVDVKEDEYNDALIVGKKYDVYDSKHVNRATIQITGMELCRWDNIPERLWQGETNVSADEFREDHRDYFNNPPDDFEFIAYYFRLVL
jgi:uncharacterized protein YhfF